MEKKHSGWGIASFIASIVAGVAIFVILGIAGVMEATTPGGLDEHSVGAVVVGLLIIALLFADVVALGLGIGGLFQKDRKKIFAVLGTVFSGVAIFGTVVLIIIGNFMK